MAAGLFICKSFLLPNISSRGIIEADQFTKSTKAEYQ